MLLVGLHALFTGDGELLGDLKFGANMLVFGAAFIWLPRWIFPMLIISMLVNVAVAFLTSYMGGFISLLIVSALAYYWHYYQKPRQQ